MKEGFTFNYASLKFLRKVIFKNFGGGGGGNRKEQRPMNLMFMENFAFTIQNEDQVFFENYSS